jgi:hypothetical protein
MTSPFFVEELWRNRAVSKILQPLQKSGAAELRASVLDCGSPLPLFPPQADERNSGIGLPQSKTSRKFAAGFQNPATLLIKPLYHI